MVNNSHQPETSGIDFGYFMEGQKSAWTQLFQQAVLDDVGIDVVQGSRVLNMGARDGRVACCLALLGAAHVTAIDSPDVDLVPAHAELVKHGVEERVQMGHYNGDLTDYDDGCFDLIVTKSALVVETELSVFLEQLTRVLAPDGAAIFLENAKGGRVVEFLRAVRHRKWGYSRATMFTDTQIELLRQYFTPLSIERSKLPPVYKFVGRKLI